MNKSLRNADLHMAQEKSELLILHALATKGRNGEATHLQLSSLGFVAYPGYQFKAPQGAALAVARLARSMQDRGLIGRAFGGRNGYGRRGYYLRPEGARALEANASSIASNN
ncbi:hypothetical protein [Diaphorobacter sp. LR2014-1]|uniref:hypothetical protein n=1 Tax=Diaphorobacter sp. LR2014-1 TaxID=1933219 RepID=UPI000CDACC1F|nr:hypothetical protein [Diaphorobacter sp. LR2014-1]POR07685.1 hypothetical protein BV908_19870 [Diaphorobacter sp. LR2014-1]